MSEIKPIENAGIEERQVTIKVLTIGKKQVTQSLYRQLEEESVLNPVTSEIWEHATIWGYVNIHTGCSSEAGHMHVIWEEYGQLKRCELSITASSEYYIELKRMLRSCFTAYLCALALENDLQSLGQPLTKLARAVDITITLAGVTLRLDFPTVIQDLIHVQENVKEAETKAKSGYEYDIHNLESQQRYLARAINKVSELRDSRWLPHKNKDIQFPSSNEVFAEISEFAKTMGQIEDNWLKSYLAIREIGQLFIAVSGVWK
jgi:hypothetical protein